jgi:flagellar hook-associated protein 3 FlgL
MISILNPANQAFVNDMTGITSQINNDQLDISSGVTMRNVSDRPDQVGALLQQRAALAASQQVSTNLGNITSEVNTGESTLESAVQLFNTVETLGAEGATSTATAGSQSTLAQQLVSIQKQMVNFANTSFAGRYIFAGDSDQTAPYNFDPTQTDPVSTYLGSASTRVAIDPSGSTFPISLTAQQIFDSSDPSTNVFSAINGLVTALQTNNLSAIQTANGGLSAVSGYLNQQLAFYGQTQDRVTAATNDAQTQQTNIQSQIGNLEDTNMTSTILNLTTLQTQEQAALGSRAQIPKTSLFDFLA